jgi:hypothetical protein
MAITRRREQLVVFRVTDREYEALKRVCEAKGGGNLSEFARTELLKSAQSMEIAALRQRLTSIEQQVSRLEAGYEESIQRL